MSNYVNDPLNLKKNAYDFFGITPETNIKSIKKVYKEYLENHLDRFTDAGEMISELNSVTKRLQMDFLYYIKEWRMMNEK